MNYILIFFAVIVVDIAWTYYLIKVQERNPIQAGIWASIIYLLGAYVVILYNQHHSYIIIAAIASFIGTALTVKYKKVLEKDKNVFKKLKKKLWTSKN